MSSMSNYLRKWSDDRGAESFAGEDVDGPRRAQGTPIEVAEDDAEAGAGSSSSEPEEIVIGFFDDMKKYLFGHECRL